MKKLSSKVKELCMEFKILTKNLPALWVSFFILAIVGMNLLANKSINTGLSWLALDAGILFSWLTFLTMDVITKRYGPRAGIMVSIIGLLANLLMALVFYIASLIPGMWSEEISAETGRAVNNTFKGTWFIILGSSAAFIVSAIVNCLLNFVIGKAFKKKPDSFVAFALRSYVSTSVGQFVDNLLFALIVSLYFFNWTIVQCVTCALTGMVLELLFEVVFSPIGFISLRRMEKEGIGQEYIDYMNAKKGVIQNESLN